MFADAKSMYAINVKDINIECIILYSRDVVGNINKTYEVALIIIHDLFWLRFNEGMCKIKSGRYIYINVVYLVITTQYFFGITSKRV